MLIFERNGVIFKYLQPRALWQQIWYINKTWTSYLSREREAPAKYHASGNLHTFKASTPELSEAVRANIPRVNRRPFSTTRGARWST